MIPAEGDRMNVGMYWLVSRGKDTGRSGRRLGLLVPAIAPLARRRGISYRGGQPIEILTRSAIWQMRLWLKVRSGDLDSIKDSFLTTVRSSQRMLEGCSPVSPDDSGI